MKKIELICKMKKKPLHNETDPILRAKELEEDIQRRYDADNWGTPGREHRRLLAIAAKIEYTMLTGKFFKPEYTCPA